MDYSYLAIQIALVIGLIETIKKAFLKEEHFRFIPLIGLFLGVAGSALLFPRYTVQQSIIDGLIVGLSPVGLFSTIKNTIQLNK